MKTVYRILNLDNGKSYVGLTDRPVIWRIKEHFKALSHKRHSIEDFQSDYETNKKGFSVEILSEIADKTVNPYEKEKEWMMFFRTYDRSIGYNYKDGHICRELRRR